MESGQLDEIVVETHMPAFLRVFQFNFDDVNSVRQTINLGSSHNITSRKSSVVALN